VTARIVPQDLDFASQRVTFSPWATISNRLLLEQALEIMQPAPGPIAAKSEKKPEVYITFLMA
jgi:hypothetical protein